MSDKIPKPSPRQEGSDKAAGTTGYAVLGGMVFVILSHVTNGKIPGGVIGGAIGGVLGGAVGFAINLLRKK